MAVSRLLEAHDERCKPRNFGVMLIKKRKNQVNSVSDRLRYALDKWPGKKTFGVYRFLPVFFCLGAALEFSMINWHVGEVNFYRTFKRRQIETALEERAGKLNQETK